MKTYNVKITGEGTIEEIAESIRQLSKHLDAVIEDAGEDDTPDNVEFEDYTIAAEIENF